MEGRPKARSEGLVPEPFGDELIVYDQISHNAHCLTPVAALVFARCDGRLSHAEIALQLGLELAAVDRTVAEFRRCELLEDDPVSEADYSRREATVRFVQIGGAAVGAPLIISMAIPPVASAASCVINKPGCIATGSEEPSCTASAIGSKAVDTLCCSCTCYNNGSGGSGNFTCEAAGCRPAGAACTSGTQCCSGACRSFACFL